MAEFSWFWNARARKHESPDDPHPDRGGEPVDPQVEAQPAEVIQADEEKLLPPVFSGGEVSKEDDRDTSPEAAAARDLEVPPSATIPSEPSLESEAIPPVVQDGQNSGNGATGKDREDEGSSAEKDAEATVPERHAWTVRRKGSGLVAPGTRYRPLTPAQRLLLLDSWRRSGLPAGDFAALVGLSKHTLYAWKKAFDREGPAGLMEKPKGAPSGSKLPDLTKRTILMLKEANPDWGCQRISDMLYRGPALPASPQTVARVLHEAGYTLEEVPTRPHPDKVRHFERAKPNQLWQTDLFTFILKRQNRRVYLVGFMDDHSRFIVGYGLHASQSTALVLEVLRAALSSYGSPEEILTDNGTQYVTWRGKSAFTKELEKRGIKQIVAAPRRPQTLGKIERFWGSLWRECVESAVFIDLADAQRRIGFYIDHYNFLRPHQGLDGLVPADRFFGAAPDVLRTLKERVAANALALARNGTPKAPFYLTGQVGGQPFSVHAEGERVILTKPGEPRQEIDLAPPSASEEKGSAPAPLCPRGEVASPPDGHSPAPGTSALDEGLRQLGEAFPPEEGGSP
jgi:transposase InsO family protein